MLVVRGNFKWRGEQGPARCAAVADPGYVMRLGVNRVSCSILLVKTA